MTGSKAHKKRYWLIGIISLLILLLIAARLYLNIWLPRYVNNALGNIKGYEGSVEDIDIALYRGAYKIHNLKIYKKTGNIPTPFVDIDTIDLSIQWRALLHGRIVSNAELTKPVINFAVGKSGEITQYGGGVDWSKTIRDLMPIDINLVTFKDGKLTYQDFSANPKVNVYINNMSGEIRNLRNVVDKDKQLPSTLIVRGNSIGGGDLDMTGKMNILRPIPDMDIETRLEHVNLPALSNYSNAYAAIDIKKGNLNVYSEFIVKNNKVSGYVKPIATDISLIDLRKTSNPIKLAWETLVSVVVEIFTNHSKDQFATKIPLEGDLDNVDTDSWATIAGIIENAFINAFKNGLDRDVDFGKPENKGN